MGITPCVRASYDRKTFLRNRPFIFATMSKRATAGLLQQLLQKAQRTAGATTMRYSHITPAAAASAIAVSSSFSTASCAFTPSDVTFFNRSPHHQHLPCKRQHHQHVTTRCSSRRYLHSQPETDEEIMQEDETGDLTSSSYATTYHAPVMATECVNAMLGIGLDDKEKKTKGKNKKKQKKMRKKDRKLAIDQEESGNGDGNDAASPDVLSQVVAHSATLPSDRPPMLFVDGTLGGGGHSEALLERCRPGDIVFGCDVDPSALSTASERLQRYTRSGAKNDDDSDDGHLPLFVPVQSNFRDLADILPTVNHPVTGKRIMALPNKENGEEEEEDGSDGDDAHFTGVDGMLLDLGVSSHQIDNADRGFAFMKDGPLDMRMWGGSWSDVGSESVGENAATKARGLNAADICNEFDEAELTRILRVYGDEPRARKIAAAIVDARPLATTSDLVNAVSSVVPEFAKKGRRMGRTATLARVFQSLRIVVNQEDEALVDVFERAAPKLVRPGGRLVVLSYHSMEDRATKRVLRDGSVRGIRPGAAIERDIYGNVVGQDRPWKPLGKKRKASDEEIEVNSRARSATLRIGERQ